MKGDDDSGITLATAILKMQDLMQNALIVLVQDPSGSCPRVGLWGRPHVVDLFLRLKYLEKYYWASRSAFG